MISLIIYVQKVINIKRFKKKYAIFFFFILQHFLIGLVHQLPHEVIHSHVEHLQLLEELLPVLHEHHHHSVGLRRLFREHL